MTEKYLTPKETAALLKYKSVRTVYRKISNGEIKYLETVRGSYRIPISQFPEYEGQEQSDKKVH